MNYWTITNSIIDKHHRLHWGMGCPPGGLDHHIDLNPDGKIQQLVTGLTVGNVYRLSFYTSVHQQFATGCGTSGTTRACVLFGTVLADTFTMNASNQPWTIRTYTFTANATSANLIFQGLSSCYIYGGVLVDHVVLSPLCNFSITATPEYTVLCQGDNLQLNVTGGGSSYVWSPAAGLSNPNIANPVLTATVSGKYIVEASDNNGCVGRDTIEVLVRPSPVVQATPEDIQVCPGDTVLLSATGGLSYEWSPASGLSNPNIPDPVLVATASRKYLVTATNSVGCKGRDSVNVTVIPPPSIEASPRSLQLCEGASAALSVSGNAASYKWTPSLGLDNPDIANPTLTAVSTQKYVVTADNGIGCLSYDSIEVTVLPSPDVQAGPEDTLVCNGAQIRCYATGAETYQWSPSAGIDNTASDAPRITVPGYGNRQYVVTGTDANGCTGTDTIHINVYPPPELTIDQTFISKSCGDTRVQLHVSGGERYKWSPGDYFDNDTIPNPIASISQTTAFILTTWDEHGCTGTDTVTVLSHGVTSIMIPNAFSPNGDGANDVFMPKIICDFTLDEFSVFNRWGEKVYTTATINQGWDGMFKGTPCSMDVYGYYVRGRNASGAQRLYKGNVTLLR